MSQSENNEQPSVALPVISIICSVLCITWPIGIILAIVSIAKYAGKNGTSAKTLSIVAIVLPVLFVPVIGILSAIAIPNFVKFQCRSKQSEAKGNLKALFVAEESFRAEQNKYDPNFATIGFSPKGAKVRYEYVVDRADAAGFHAIAKVNPAYKTELGEDTWEIDNTNRLNNVVNGCN